MVVLTYHCFLIKVLDLIQLDVEVSAKTHQEAEKKAESALSPLMKKGYVVVEMKLVSIRQV